MRTQPESILTRHPGNRQRDLPQVALLMVGADGQQRQALANGSPTPAQRSKLRARDPSPDEIADLIRGTRKLIAEVF